jgi:hypothetical protein
MQDTHGAAKEVTPPPHGATRDQAVCRWRASQVCDLRNGLTQLIQHVSAACCMVTGDTHTHTHTHTHGLADTVRTCGELDRTVSSFQLERRGD